MTDERMVLRRKALPRASVPVALAVLIFASAKSLTAAESQRRNQHCYGGASPVRVVPAFIQSTGCRTARRQFHGLSSHEPHRPCDDENFFLNQVETTISSVLQSQEDEISIKHLPVDQRETVSVARNLDERINALRKTNDCPRCWLHRAHCICDVCRAVDNDHVDKSMTPYANLNRIFLVMHHKEIAMKIDTAKLILSAFPSKCRLVVAGIGAEHQPSMQEMDEAIHQSNNDRTCFLLFPDENARTLEEIALEMQKLPQQKVECEQKYDLIVLDGTWSQARKFVSKYFLDKSSGEFVPNVQSVKLSDKAVDILGREGSTQAGHQLRRHCTSWRQIGTFEATRLFLQDWSQVWTEGEKDAIPIWKQIESYQRIANEAATKEIGPPRKSKGKQSKD